MKVELSSYTQGTEGSDFHNKGIDEIIVGMARVSSSREVNDLFEDPSKLLRHCLSNGHWSIFDTCNLTFKIETSRAMGRELLRHDLKPQELSQRYAPIVSFETVELRHQSESNRQSSVDNVEDIEILSKLEDNLGNTINLYEEFLEKKIAKETARMILPETATTVLYLNGTVRVWLSVLNQRLHETAQKEIRLIAQEIKDIFIRVCPIISEMVFNFEDAEKCHIFERIILEKYGVFSAIKKNDFKKLKTKDFK